MGPFLLPRAFDGFETRNPVARWYRADGPRVPHLKRRNPQARLILIVSVLTGCGGGGGSGDGDGSADTEAPTVAVTVPASGETVSGTTILGASATDNVGVAAVQFQVDGANVGAEDTTAPYSTSWSAASATSGMHSVTAVARDAAGNAATSAPVSISVTVDTVDAQGPTVAVTSPGNGTTVSGTIALTATASDNVGVAGVQFQLDGIDVGAEDTTTPYSVSWSTESVTNTVHSISAVARDAAGNTTTSAPVSITVSTADTQAPTVTVTAPANGAIVSGTPTLSANASDNVGIAGVQFQVDGANVGAEDTIAPYAASWDTEGVASGTRSLTAVARDAAGNTTTSAPVSITVTVSSGDTQSPTVTVTAPVSGATVSGITPVAASAADNIGVVGVRFRIDGANVGVEDTTAPYATSWNTSAATNAAHSLTAVARDAAGNTTTSAPVSVTVNNADTQAPTVAVTAPANGDTVSGTTTLSANATDNVGIAGVQFRVDGVDAGAEDTTAPYATSWSTEGVTNAVHSLTAVARDAAGNTTTSAPVSVTVSNADTEVPTVTLTAPASGAAVSGTVTVTATAADNVGVVGVQFRLDDNDVGAEDLTPPYSASWATTSTVNGSHTLTAVARDAAGLTASASIPVTVSNAAGSPLTINGSQQFQTIDGFGVSANSASWDNGELRPAIDTLVANGSTIWRVIIEMADWEATNDDSDPDTFNWTYYNSIYSSPRFEELWSTLAYLNTKGITSNLMLNFMGRGPAWMGGADLPTGLEDEWVETVASVAYYARNTRGVDFGIFAPNNESDWDGIEGIRMDSAQYTRVMRKLAQKLDALGLGDLRLIGPDTADIYSGVNAFLPAMLADPLVMSKVDHFAFHNYAGNSATADSAIRNSDYPDRNFWMTELSLIGDAMANIGQGAAAILVWDGYDSVYNHGILAGRGTTPPNDAGNGPALLAYSSTTRLYTARKALYEFAQLFKFVPAGSVRVAATESSSNVTLYAFHHPLTGRVTLVGRNTGGAVTFSGTLSNLPDVPVFEFYQTDSAVNLQRGTDVAVTNGAFAFTAPANSVFTLTYAGN